MATFTNQAQLRYGDAVTNSNIAVGEILEVLSAAKTAVKTEYRQNDRVTYVVSMVNSGATVLNGISVTDNLGTFTQGLAERTPLDYVADSVKYYSNGVLQPAPAVTAGPPLVISGISIPAGGNAILVYEADINAYAPLAAASAITNTATITGGGITPVTVEADMVVAAMPRLTITKTISPVPVTENGTLTYTFQIQNTGNEAVGIGANAVVTDTFQPILSNLAVSFNGTAWVAGTNYTYDETTGLFASTAGQITVPAATYTTDPDTGEVIVTPGVSTLVVTGTI